MTERARRDFLTVAAVGFGALAAAGCSRTSARRVHGEHTVTEDTGNLTPDQALEKLKAGNARFVAMKEVEPNLSSDRLLAVARGQKPFVGVLGCVDSRVPPELVFDRGLGDVFDARIAGAIADDAAVGSLEFGVDEFGVPLLVVLGHSKCGAVTAAVKALKAGEGGSPGKIGAIVDPITPVVKEMKATGVSDDQLINAAGKEVVRRGEAALVASPVLKERLDSGRLKVVGAFYDLDTGKVEFL